MVILASNIVESHVKENEGIVSVQLPYMLVFELSLSAAEKLSYLLQIRADHGRRKAVDRGT